MKRLRVARNIIKRNRGKTCLNLTDLMYVGVFLEQNVDIFMRQTSCLVIGNNKKRN
jgi:hypothetical protein